MSRIVTPITAARSKALLRRAVGLLVRANINNGEIWQDDTEAFYADLVAALGVNSFDEALVALGRGRGHRGPDLKPRRRPGEKSLDLSPGRVAGSDLSREDCSDPARGTNDDVTDVDQIAAAHTVAALRFQQMSV